MTQQVFARAMHDDLWQWLISDAQGQWQDKSWQSGDSEALKAALPSASTPIHLALRGQQVVATEVNLDAKQSKHAAKLIPFELEDEISSNVDDLHFAFKQIHDDHFTVLYADQSYCLAPISVLSEEGLDVQFALPEYLLLDRPENGLCVLLENDIVYARLSEHWGFAVEKALAGPVLARYAERSAYRDTPPQCIDLVAQSDAELDALKLLLPEAWAEVEQHTRLGGFWDCLETRRSTGGLNLRSGRLARQLPIARWWRLWRRPTYFFIAAFVVALCVNLGLFYAAKSKEKRVLAQINEVYLDAVPGGRLGDVEGILESKLKALGGSDSEAPTNLVYLLSKVTQVVAASDNARLTNFNYNGDQMHLQLTLEVDALSTLGDIRAALTKLGVSSESPRTTALGEGYQARMRLSEAK